MTKSKNTETQRCCMRISDSRGLYSRQCKKPGHFEHEGQQYCGLHHPVRKAARDKIRNEVRTAIVQNRFARRAETTARRDLEEKICKGLSNTELQTILRQGGLKELMGHKA